MSKLDIGAAKNLILDAPIGRYIGDRGAQVFAKCADCIVDLEDNDFLFKEGETTSSFYIVIQGRLAIVKTKKEKDSKLRILHILEKSDLIGELSFIDDTHHTASVMAIGDAQVLEFKAEKISNIIDVMAESDNPTPFMRKVETLEQRRNTIMQNLEKAEQTDLQSNSLSDINEFEVQRALNAIFKQLDKSDTDNLKDFIKNVVVKIVLKPENQTRMLIHYSINIRGFKMASPRGISAKPLILAVSVVDIAC
ncbi:MAG: hypothetical protein COA83_04570 [Methylophaga sp.]|nr:MAG: hypothetical protein COA83_04570 [Methylophaga sp.]